MRVNCWQNRVFEFEPDSTAILVIDMQRDFLAPDGNLALRHGGVKALAAIIPKVTKVLTEARGAGLMVIHTREGYSPDRSDVNAFKRTLGYVGVDGPNGPFLIRGTPGHDFLEGFQPQESEYVVDKPGFSAFYRTDLETILSDQGISHLILAGITTQCCVHSTLRDAVDRGYFCLTIEDCCAAENQEIHDATMKIIQAENHLFGWITNSEDLIDALSGVIEKTP